jgi:GGDEF domain-containing protein
VTDEASSHRAPRARPVAELPIEELSGQADELARAWAVALIVARPPSAIADIPLEDLACDAPRLCSQMLRALESDEELERLTELPRDSAREVRPSAQLLAGLAGARDVASVVAAMEALRGVLWEALLAELRRPVFDRYDAHLLADLADRLAYVCAMALAAALPAALARDPQIRGRSGVVVAGADSAPPPARGEPVAPPGPLGRGEPVAPPGPLGRGEPVAPPGPLGRGEVVIIDERPHAHNPPRVVVAREPSTGEPAQSAGEMEPSPYPPPAASRSAPPQQPASPAWQSPSPAAASRRESPDAAWDAPPPPPPAAPAEIEIRDERLEEGPAAWIRSIGRELERFAQEARPFTVLLIELMDVEHLNRTELPEEVLRLAARVERTLELELRTISERRAGSLTREAPGRFWLLAPGVGVLRAGALADQVAEAVRRSVSHRGQPLEIAVGTAVCPDDGVQAPALAAHADVALYAARAGGSAGYGPAR